MSPSLRVLKTGTTYLLLVLASLLLLLPFFFALSVALQGETVTPHFLPDLRNLDWSVFARALQQQPDLVRWVINSFAVALAVTAGVLITSALAAYAFATLQFWGKTFFFLLALGTLMIPFEPGRHHHLSLKRGTDPEHADGRDPDHHSAHAHPFNLWTTSTCTRLDRGHF